MTAYNVTTGANATTEYTGFDEFDSFCIGPDGIRYGLKADGLYRLTGSTDNGGVIGASAGFGQLDFGTTKLKRCPNVYLGVEAAKPMIVTVNGYSYPTRSSSSDLTVQRADVGRGIRAGYLSVSVANSGGADFSLESVEVLAEVVDRRI